MHLDKTRRKKQHLHPSNYTNHYYRKYQRFLDRKANVNSSMGIRVETLNNIQRQSAIENMVNIICAKVEEVEEEIYEKMQLLLFKTLSLKNREQRIKAHKIRAVKPLDSDDDSLKTSESLKSD